MGEANAAAAPVRVGVVQVGRKSLGRSLTVSAELVPFQETDVYAKESGYVHTLLVDYGSRVHAGQLMAVLEIPELEAQLRQDDAMIRNASDRIARARMSATASRRSTMRSIFRPTASPPLPKATRTGRAAGSGRRTGPRPRRGIGGRLGEIQPGGGTQRPVGHAGEART